MSISMPHVWPAIRKAGPLTLLFISAALASAQTAPGIFPLLPPTVSTVPSNGDVNPYGVAFVPKTVPTNGVLQPGDILVSNFNNSQNLQGTGTTIIRVDKTGKTSTFFTSPAPAVGLTAALGVLSNGVVLVGNLPTSDGTSATAQPGRLAVLDNYGRFLGTFGTLTTVDGPWGMAIYDVGNGVTGTARLFLSNVLSGEVSRFDISYNSQGLSGSVIVLATGFSHRPDPAALELGPSGLAYDRIHDVLYVASSADNAIYQIANAAVAQGTVSATLLFQDIVHLHGPLDMTILPDGHLLVANSDGSNADPNQPSELVEFTAGGEFVGQMPVDPNNGGAFGLAINNFGWGAFRLAAVDDNANTLSIWTTVIQ
jgi:hypothetical protein